MTTLIFAHPEPYAKRKTLPVQLFFFGWLLHGSTSLLSGRSPFCQLRMGEDVAKALDIKHQVKQQRKLKQTKNQTTMQPPRECKGRVKVACSSDGRSRAGWRRREHACQPSEGEGTACSKGWKVLRNYETSTYY